MDADRRTEGVTAGIPERLLVSVLALGAIAALFQLRAHDDNRFTSWTWVFAEANPARLFALAAAAIVLANVAATLPLPRRGATTALFVSSYAIGACFWGAPEVIVDAARYFTQAKHLEVYGLRHFANEWGRVVPAWTDLPLVPFLYGLVLELFGEARIHVQAFTTLLFAAAVVLTARIGESLWDREVGLVAGALLLASPYLLAQVPAMLVDVPTLFFLTLAVHAVIRAFQRGGAGRILLAALAVFLALLSKYSCWLLLSVLPVIALVLGRRGAPRPLRTAASIALVAGSLLAVVLLLRRDVHSEQLALLLHYQAPGLRRWGESFTSTFLFQVHPFLTAAAALSLWVALERRDARWAIVAWPVLLLLLLQVRRARYLLPAFPMLALMGAYGLQRIASPALRRLVLACTVGSSLVVALHGYLPFLRSTSAANLRAAGEYLDSIDEERVEVFALAGADAEVNPAVSVAILDLYTAKEVIHREERPSPPPGVETSPLRFTWELGSPAYYAEDGAARSAAVVVVSDELGRPLPARLATRLEGHHLARTFAADEGVFRHRTLVEVYRAPPAADGARR